VFRVLPNFDAGESALYIPYWALEPADLLSFLMGRLDDRPLAQILDRIFDHKLRRAEKTPIDGVDLTSLTVDTPIPYSLKKLWLELVDPEVKTWEDAQKTVPALEEPGDAETLKAPKYRPHSAGSAAPFMNQVGVLGIRRQLDQMRSRLLDRQYDFLLHPGPWEPDLRGNAREDLASLLKSWLGHDNPITILDLSGIPSIVLIRLIGAILAIIYEGLFWARDKSEGGIERPLLIVMEEAHRYLSAVHSGSPARDMVQRIVKEGRKFGIGAMIVSQRPSEIDETILSQCGTFIALRLSNSTDRARVQAALPDSLAGIIDSLPVLRTGEAVITGEAARLPIRCRITLPRDGNRPNSEDPEVAKCWRSPRKPEGYDRMAASWRAQNPRWASNRPPRTKLEGKEIEKMERAGVISSTIISVGYDKAAETLEVEFKSGVYQYYNVPEPVYEQFVLADSKGKFHAAYIKNSYPFSKM
jgi:hypothetical protein